LILNAIVEYPGTNRSISFWLCL